MTGRSEISRSELLKLIDPERKNSHLGELTIPQLMVILQSKKNNIRRFTEDEFSFPIEKPKLERQHRMPKKSFQNVSITPRNISSGIRSGPKMNSPPKLQNYSDEPYIRPPDQSYCEQLIPSSNGHYNIPVRREPDEDEYERVLQESLKTYQEEQDYVIDDSMIDDLFDDEFNVNDLLDDLIDVKVEKKDRWCHLIDIPDGFVFSELELLYDELKKLDFQAARERISKIPEIKHMDYIKALSYEKKALRTMVATKNPDAYKCIDPN